MRLNYEEYNLSSSKVNNLRIVQLSDIHFHYTFDINKFNYLVNKIKNLNPNYICITGDFIDNGKVLDNDLQFNIFKKFLTDLSLFCKVIIIIGNHELLISDKYLQGQDLKVIEKIKTIKDIIILNNQIYNDNNINFIGFNPGYNYYNDGNKNSIKLSKIFNDFNFKIENKYNILLTHISRDIIDNISKFNNLNKVDLILAGHNHGGMMPYFIKGHIGLVSPNLKLFPKNVRGLIKRDNTNIIISQGITRLSYKTGLIRYFNDIYGMCISIIDIK